MPRAAVQSIQFLPTLNSFKQLPNTRKHTRSQHIQNRTQSHTHTHPNRSEIVASMLDMLNVIVIVIQYKKLHRTSTTPN